MAFSFLSNLNTQQNPMSALLGQALMRRKLMQQGTTPAANPMGVARPPMQNQMMGKLATSMFRFR